jgi:WD domain, G-beta repeat
LIQALRSMENHGRFLNMTYDPYFHGMLEGHSSTVNGVAVTADEKRAVSASHDRTLKEWGSGKCPGYRQASLRCSAKLLRVRW